MKYKKIISILILLIIISSYLYYQNNYLQITNYNIENTTMIVSRGIGNSIIPFRINNRPELVIITLNR